MSQFVSFGVTNPDISARLRFVNILPAALLLTMVGLVLLSGAPAHNPSWVLLVAHGRRAGWLGLALASAGTLVLGLLLQPLELATIRFLEGYWRPRGPLGRLARLGEWRQEERRRRLIALTQAFGEKDPIAVDASRELALLPHHQPVLPTDLGNRLRAAEERAGWPYRIKALQFWPRLFFVLPPEAARIVAESRDQLDVSTRLCLSFGLTSVICEGLLFGREWWQLLPLGTAGLSWLSYRASVHAAASYGVSFTAAIDVYRFRLLTEMHVKLPTDAEQERIIQARINRLWRRKDTGLVGPPVEYDTGSPPPAP